jgi:hypothetical protein
VAVPPAVFSVQYHQVHLEGVGSHELVVWDQIPEDVQLVVAVGKNLHEQQRYDFLKAGPFYASSRCCLSTVIGQAWDLERLPNHCLILEKSE